MNAENSQNNLLHFPSKVSRTIISSLNSFYNKTGTNFEMCSIYNNNLFMVFRLRQPLVCNITQSEDNPMSWEYILDTGRKHLYENPLSGAIWFPDGSIKSSWLVHTLCVIFFHFLPAYIIDLLVTLCGKKPL